MLHKITTRILFSIFISVLAFHTAFAQSPQYIEALGHYFQGRDAQAEECFKKLVAEDPQNDAAWFYLGMLSNDSETSIALFKRASEIDPSNFWYKYYIAMCYASSNEFEYAAVLYEKLMEEYPQRSNSLAPEAISLYLRQNDAEKALSTMEQIEKKRGTNDRLAMMRFRLLMQLKRTDEAKTYLEDFFTSHPSAPVACMLGDLALHEKDESLALEYYDKASELDPSYTEANYAKSNIYRAYGKFDLYFENIMPVLEDAAMDPNLKAQYLEELTANPQFVQTFMPQVDSMYMAAFSTHPLDSALLSTCGSYFYKTGRVDESLNFFDALTHLCPDDIDPAFNKTLIHYYSENYMKAIECATLGIQKFPYNVDFLQIRGICYSIIGELESSASDYHQMLILAPKDSGVAVIANTALGDIYHQLNDNKRAYQHYEKALKVNPEYVHVLNNYAYYLSVEFENSEKNIPSPNERNLKKALEMSRKTIIAEPDNATYLDTYAWILHLMGMDLEAKSHFKHAMLYGGKQSPVILEHYATVLEALGESDLAEIYRRQAKNLNFE